MKPIKQVLIWNNSVRNHLGQKVRTGKIGAQLAHASLQSYLNCVSCSTEHRRICTDWMHTNYTKIVLKVESLHELNKIYKKCVLLKIPCYLVEDVGNTEFNGIPTITALGIGPDYSEDIDKICKGLSLL